MAVRDRVLELGGRRVRYVEAGSGPGVAIVHGLGLSGAIFRMHCRALAAAGFRAVAPDLPGFGGSEGPRFGLSVPETADWLLGFADACGLGSVCWLGHSLAAQAVLELAARAPHRARALVLVTPTGAPGRSRLLRQAWRFVRDIGREPLSLVPAVARQYARGSPTAFIGTWLKAARDRPLDKTPRVRCPTLIVAGRRDPVAPEDFIAVLAARIPGARVAALHAAGHGAVFDRAGEFDRVVAEFLRRVAAGPGSRS